MTNNERIDQAVERLRSGDKNSFDELYELTYKGVYFTVFGVLKEASLTEDIVQSTYLISIEKLDRFKPHTNFKAWICRIARNLAINEFNQRKKEVQVDYQESDFFAGSISFEEQENSPTLFLASQILSEDEFRILVLCELAGYKRREVSEIMDIPIPTVTWKYLNALKKLRKALEKEEAFINKEGGYSFEKSGLKKTAKK